MAYEEHLSIRERLARPLTVIVAAGSLAVAGVVINYSPDPQSRPLEYVVPELACASPEGQLPGPDLETAATINESIQAAKDVPIFAPQNNQGEFIQGVVIAPIDTPALERDQQAINEWRSKGLRSDLSQAGQNESNALFSEQNVDNANATKIFMAEQGITVSSSVPLTAKQYVKEANDDNTPAEAAYGQLALIPRAIVEASGLKRIVFTNTKDNYRYFVPKVEGETMYVQQAIGIVSALSEMVINNCTNKQAILSRFVQLTTQSGHSYYPQINLNDGKQEKAIDSKSGIAKRGQTIYYGWDSDLRGPEAEFTDIFSDIVPGWEQYSSADLKTTVGKKIQLAEAVYDSIVPEGQELEEFDNEVRSYISQASEFTPQSNIDSLQTMFRQLDEAKTGAERQTIIKSYQEDGSYMTPAEAAAFDRIPTLFSQLEQQHQEEVLLQEIKLDGIG